LFAPKTPLFTASQPFLYGLLTKLSYTIHPAPFPRHEIANISPSHSLQKNQHKNTVPTTKKNINPKKILATHNQKAQKKEKPKPNLLKREIHQRLTASHHLTFNVTAVMLLNG